jgi:hypothetical protein
MDRTGDTRHTFDARDRAAVEDAEKRFTELTGVGLRPTNTARSQWLTDHWRTDRGESLHRLAAVGRPRA